MPSRSSAHSSRLESWVQDDECGNRATRGSATDGANKNRATRGSATDGASKNRATRGSATVGGPVAEARQEFRAAGARARLSPKEARRWTILSMWHWFKWTDKERRSAVQRCDGARAGDKRRCSRCPSVRAACRWAADRLKARGEPAP